MYLSFHKIVERISHFLALLGFSGLLILSIMVVLDIILRSLIEFPLKGVNDVSAVVMAVVISACIPQSLLIKQSITVEILGQSLGGRANLLLNVVASAAVLTFFTLLAFQFIPYATSLTASGEQTWVLKWPVGPWWWTATVFFFVSVCVQALVLIDDVVALLIGRPWSPTNHSPDQGA